LTKWLPLITSARNKDSWKEIIPSKITAKMNSGILQVDAPKKSPSRPAGGSTTIEME